MIKYNWTIKDEEKNRILKLHETATKKHYLLREQEEGKKEGQTVTKHPEGYFPAYRLCSEIVYIKNQKAYVFIKENANDENETPLPVEIPFLSQIGATFKEGKKGKKGKEYIYKNESYLNGEQIADYFLQNGSPCYNQYPRNYGGNWKFIVFLDDFQRETAYPIWGGISFDGSFGGGSNLIEGAYETTKNEVLYGQKRTENYVLEVQEAVRATPYKEPTKPEPFVFEYDKPFELNLIDSFKFDQVEFNSEKAETDFKNFVNEVKKYYSGKTGEVHVYAYASIDGDPNQKLQNGQTRHDYNADLSTKRATHIADRLKKETGITTLTFTPHGMGETDKFGPAWTKEKPTKPEETRPNRRLTIQFPTIQVPAQKK